MSVRGSDVLIVNPAEFMGKFGSSGHIIQFISESGQIPKSCQWPFVACSHDPDTSLTLCFVPDEVRVGCAPGGGQPGGP